MFLTMSFIILTASPIELAWNPMLAIPAMRSSTVTLLPAKALKSNSSTFLEPAGISSDFTRTAAATDSGTAPPPLDAMASAGGGLNGYKNIEVKCSLPWAEVVC